MTLAAVGGHLDMCTLTLFGREIERQLQRDIFEHLGDGKNHPL